MIPAVTTTLMLAILALVALHSRRHKRHLSTATLINTTAIVDKPLTPIGAVLIDGELWLARTINDCSVPSRTRVTVVGIDGHLLLVS